MARILVVALVALLGFTFQACEPDYPIQPNAKILDEGIDCGWLIEFYEKPETLPDSEGNIYIVVNLEEKYQVKDLEVKATVREVTADEALVCTALGTAYVQVFIEDIF